MIVNGKTVENIYIILSRTDMIDIDKLLLKSISNITDKLSNTYEILLCFVNILVHFAIFENTPTNIFLNGEYLKHDNILLKKLLQSTKLGCVCLSI